jgi:hypothetical protein
MAATTRAGRACYKGGSALLQQAGDLLPAVGGAGASGERHCYKVMDV